MIGDICFGCGNSLPIQRMAGFAYCDQKCLDRHAAAILRRKRGGSFEGMPDGRDLLALPPKPRKPKRRWCAWCGDDLPSDKKKFCSVICRDDFVADMQAAHSLAGSAV
jgi:hypothetical protein